MIRVPAGRIAWAGSLGMLLAAAGCASHPAIPPAPPPAAPALCRIGPDGARPIADRGIGGTGSPAIQTTDRGIGGTGIIGVITGFASLCLAGEEVALPPGLPATIDEEPGVLDDLRAGQRVSLEASGPPGALQARHITVQHAIIGPVQATGPGTMTVAGQLVFIADATGKATGARTGDWVAVSGLHQTENTLVATRIDPAPPGRVLVRGELVGIYGTFRIGSLQVRLVNDSHPPGGWPVVAIGHLDGSVLVADRLFRDIAAESPSAYFGPTVTNFIVEDYVSVVAGGYLVDRDFVSGGGFAEIGSRGRGVARFSRGEGGGLMATSLRLGNGAAAAGGGFTPAPVPHGETGPHGNGPQGRFNRMPGSGRRGRESGFNDPDGPGRDSFGGQGLPGSQGSFGGQGGGGFPQGGPSRR